MKQFVVGFLVGAHWTYFADHSKPVQFESIFKLIKYEHIIS